LRLCGLCVRIFTPFFTSVFASAQVAFTDIQTFIDSNITRNFLYTNFDNQVQSMDVYSKMNFSRSVGKVNFYAKNYYSSAVTKLQPNLYRDFDNVKTGIGYDLKDNLNISANYLGFFYSDDKTISFKGSSSSFLFLSGYYENSFNSAAFWSRLNSGYKFESQIGEFDRGPALNAELDILNLNLSDYLVDANLKLGYEYLIPRRNNFVISKFHVGKSYSDNLVQNELDGNISRVKRDSYLPADDLTRQQFSVSNNIEKRTETIIRAFEKLDYFISGPLVFTLNFFPYYRDIVKENAYIPISSTIPPSFYDTEIQELNIAGDAALSLDLNKISLQIRMGYSERDVKYYLLNPQRINQNFVRDKERLESSKNNHSSKVSLNGSIFYSPTLHNRFEISGSTSLFRYDTPSEDNSDDRDELNIIGYVSHRYDNLKNLLLVTSVDLNLYHTVYIFAARSANNNWNRILRFTSKSFFTPHKNFRTVNTVSVLANYTVYDFEDILSSVKSFSFRQFNAKDSTTYKFSQKAGVRVYGELRLYERGELNWREFSSRPVNYYEDRIVNPELFYHLTKSLIIYGGYKYFEQRRFNYTKGVRVFDVSIKTYGPVGKLRLEYKANSFLELNASYEKYDYGGSSPSADNLNFYVNVLWNF
jgi:hypothetical protein